MTELELRRVEALKNYQILDTAPEQDYDSITTLASYICKTPAALINFIDEKRQWTKSRVGMEIDEIPREVAFCQHTIQNKFLLEIKDALEDERFTDNALVTGPPQIRYYAGVPLITPEGEHIGALCAIDFEPNELDEHQKAALRVLAREVIAHLEIEKKNRILNQMLAEAQEFRDLFNSSADIHCIATAEGEIAYINDTVTELLGFEINEVKQKTLWEFCFCKEKEAVLQQIEPETSSAAVSHRIENKVLNKAGEPLWLEWCIVLKNDKWFVSGRDITIRKKFEQELKILSLAVEKSAAGVFIRTEKGEIEWYNPAVAEITGYPLEEMRGKSFGTLLVGKQTDKTALEVVLKRAGENLPYEVEIILYRKDATPIWVFISNNPLFNEKGEVERQIGIMIDITERKRAEEQLVKAKEDAIKLSEAKENFLSVMSHEMRTPLNAVIGMTRILKDEQPLDRQKDNLNILEFSANNLLTLINDVLDFTKIETGNLELETIPVNLTNLVSKTIESLKFKTKDTKVEVLYDIDKALPEVILGDSTRLYQIFMNLLGNAVKFTNEGEVKLSLKLEKETAKDLRIAFEVSDTGIGIPANKLRSIFDPYTQAESDTARKYGGTGLGLAITQKLIKLHQSEIHVKSEPGKGTCFYFTISFLKDETKLNQTLIEEEETELNARILVVDDNAMNRLLARKILGKWKVTVDFAENGLEAVQKAKENAFDLILMDIHMPVMGGFEAAKSLRASGEQLGLVPIIALTGSMIDTKDEEFRESGMNDFILKPFEPSNLYRKIKPFVSSR